MLVLYMVWCVLLCYNMVMFACSCPQVNVWQSRCDMSEHSHQLEAEVRGLKMDNAKLVGSYKALLAIKCGLGEENCRLSSSINDLQTDNKVLVEDKNFLLRKVEGLARQQHQFLSNSQPTTNVCCGYHSNCCFIFCHALICVHTFTTDV